MGELVCVPPEMNGKMWPLVKDLIRSAIEKTGLSRFENIERDILNGGQLLWIVWNGSKIEAAASTAIEGDALVIVACGGSQLENWIGVTAKIEEYAKSIGCQRVRIYGRKGWEKVLPEYRSRFVILERPL